VRDGAEGATRDAEGNQDWREQRWVGARRRGGEASGHQAGGCSRPGRRPGPASRMQEPVPQTGSLLSTAGDAINPQPTAVGGLTVRWWGGPRRAGRGGGDGPTPPSATATPRGVLAASAPRLASLGVRLEQQEWRSLFRHKPAWPHANGAVVAPACVHPARTAKPETRELQAKARHISTAHSHQVPPDI